MAKLVLIAVLLLQFFSLPTVAQTLPKLPEGGKFPPGLVQVPGPANSSKDNPYQKKIDALNEVIKAQDEKIAVLQYELEKCKEETHGTKPQSTK